MKKTLIRFRFLLLILLFSLVAGCGVKPVAQTDPVPETFLPADPVKISYRVQQETLLAEDGSPLLEMKSVYPVLDNPNNESSIQTVNQMLAAESERFWAQVLDEGRSWALNEKKGAQEIGYDFLPLSYGRTPVIHYNANGLFSLVYLRYENTGGAHPNYFQEASTFDIKQGKRIGLEELLGLSAEETLTKVSQIVLPQAQAKKENDENIFSSENLAEDLKKYYQPKDFYLAEEGVVFYYQIYSLAPFAAGIPSFSLPYAKAKELTRNVPALSAEQEAKELAAQAEWLIDSNIEIFQDIYGLHMLPLDLPLVRTTDQWVFPVKNPRFLQYSDLETFIRSVYCKKEADNLLGNGRYLNKGGALYGDLRQDAGTGYYVDWHQYSYKLTDIHPDTASLTIHALEKSPAGPKEIELKMNLVREEGHWRLEKMIL